MTAATRDGDTMAGLLVGAEVIRFGAEPGTGDGQPTLRELLGDPRLPERISKLVAAAAGGDVAAAARHRLDAVRLLAPIPDPRKVVGVGLNYRSHADEAGREAPDYPVLFAKFANSIVGPEDPIVIPRVSHRIDYEGELAVVVGTGGRYIPEASAMQHVAGFTVANDVSARDYQFRTKEMFSGKGFDGFAPIGPHIVTPDEVGDLGPLRLTTHVNGERRQSATLGEMIFPVPFLVAYISDIVTLEPGDLILTGTPAGIGATMEPRRWLRPGDEVVIEIERVGRLRNRVEAESPS